MGVHEGRAPARGLGLPGDGRTRTLDSHASRLRRKIAAVTGTPYVLNEWGAGYRLMLPA
jgi:DNA-binding response OmpR family regulator